MVALGSIDGDFLVVDVDEQVARDQPNRGAEMGAMGGEGGQFAGGP